MGVWVYEFMSNLNREYRSTPRLRRAGRGRRTEGRRRKTEDRYLLKQKKADLSTAKIKLGVFGA